MKKDNLFINFNELDMVRYDGTISHNGEIEELKNIDKSHDFIRKVIDPKWANEMLIYTHSGRHHADECMAVALILLARNTIANQRDGKLYNINDICKNLGKYVKRVPSIDAIIDFDKSRCVILDLKDGHYDHHHENQDNRLDFPIPMGKFGSPNKCATFGALWNDIGRIFNIENVLAPNKNVWELMLKWIFPMDQQDNYGPNYMESPVSKIISNINSYSDFENYDDLDSSEIDFRFVEAVKMSYTILRNEIMSTQKLVQSIKEVTEKCNIIELSTYHDFAKTAYEEEPIITAVEIAAVKEGETAPMVMIDAVNNTIVEAKGQKVIPIMLINHNPDQRDGALRVVFGKYAKLNVTGIKEKMGDKIKFIHPNGGFLVTFTNESDLLYFLIHFKEHLIFDYRKMRNDIQNK